MTLDTALDWDAEMAEVCRLGEFLNSCNVISINFTNKETIDVFVATSSEQRTQGLAQLPSLGMDGMLFCYETPTYGPFTMKDMLFDLDIAFFEANGELISWSTETAGSTAPVASPKPFSYVLECPAGTFVQSSLVVRHG